MQKIKQNKSLGTNIAKLRRKSKMTQDQVIAKMHLLECDICRSSYSKLERGKRNISSKELVALKHIFKTEYSEIFKGFEPNNLYLISPDIYHEVSS